VAGKDEAQLDAHSGPECSIAVPAVQVDGARSGPDPLARQSEGAASPPGRIDDVVSSQSTGARTPSPSASPSMRSQVARAATA
jgi:hypothetical protein